MRTLISVLVLGLSMQVFAAGLDTGRAAYQRGDYRTARAELTPYADSGEPQAQYLLGRMFANGEGVLQDYVQAHKWLNLASAGGQREARALRDTISSRMTSGQLAEAQSLARQWQPKAAPSRTVAATPAPAPAAQSRTPARTSRSSAPRSRRSMLRDVQSMLAELGYDPGPADGLMGRRTRNAIRSYQLHSGLEVDGQPSESLAGTLRADLGYADSGSTTAAPSAGASAPARSSASSSSGGSSMGSSTGSATTSSAPVYVQEAEAARQSSRTTSSSSRATPASPPPAEPIARLRKLVDQARSRGAADRRFLEDLEDLLSRYDYPWRRVLLEDRFRDGNYTRGPAWRVLSGQFWVARGEGLRSQVQTSTPSSSTDQSQGSDSRKDLPLAILGAILNQSQGGRGTSDAGATGGDAEIVLATRIPTSFAMEATLLSGSPEGRFEIGVYQGGRADTGYRLAYMPGASRPLELARVNGTQQSVIELYTQPLTLEDGQPHAVLWTRDGNGRMRVTIDGQEMLSVTDRGFRGGFDGIVVANRGGNYGLKEVRVLGE